MRMRVLFREKSCAQSFSRGFTLVEMMVVVAIIGILMIVALPAYNNYSTKSKFAEVVIATAPTKTAISTCAGTGDCVSGNAISLNTNSTAPTTVPGLVVPSQANASYATMLAIQVAGSVYQNRGDSAATSAGYATNDNNAGMYVTVDPANPTYVCIIFLGGCYPGSDTPLTLWNQAYPPNAALLAAAATPGSDLPCIGASAPCSPPTKYAAAVSYDMHGVITATAQTTSGLNAETFVLVPNYSSGRVDWAASGTCKTRAGGALC